MTNLKKKLSKLPPDKIAELEQVTGKIIETGLAEIIILYGSHARGDFKDGRIIEIEGSRVQRRSDYDILVVTDQHDATWRFEKFSPRFSRPWKISGAEIKIRGKLRGIDLPVQIIVEQIDEINQRLEEKQYFYSDVKREGIVLYDTGKCRLSDPPEEITPAVRLQYAEDEFRGWHKTALVNFENSIFNYEKGKKDKDFIKQASFHLEQVCEMCYKCILLVYTHYAADEHDLYALRREAEKYEPLLKEVFPLETEEQENLFEKLNLAYIGARYIRTFTVEPHEIEHWKPEAEKLLSLTEQTCRIKIEALRRMAVE